MPFKGVQLILMYVMVHLYVLYKGSIFFADDLNHMLIGILKIILSEIIQFEENTKAHPTSLCKKCMCTEHCIHILTHMQMGVNHPCPPAVGLPLINRACHINLILKCSETVFYKKK